MDSRYPDIAFHSDNDSFLQPFLQVRMSQYPVPTINRIDHSGDWFSALQRCMSWNERVAQRPV